MPLLYYAFDTLLNTLWTYAREHANSVVRRRLRSRKPPAAILRPSLASSPTVVGEIKRSASDCPQSTPCPSHLRVLRARGRFRGIQVDAQAPSSIRLKPEPLQDAPPGCSFRADLWSASTWIFSTRHLRPP